MTGSTPRFPCPCCGFLVFARPPGSYELCPVCDWEDDALQLEFATTLAGGANQPTLEDAQKDFADAAASRRLTMRQLRARTGAERDPEWRPVDRLRDTFETFGAPGRPRAPDDDGALYYWRDTFWRRGGSDPRAG